MSSNTNNPCNLLVITACDTCEGDVNMLLLALANLPPGAFRVHAVSVPRGDVFARLRALPNITVTGMDMGGAEARSPERKGKGWKAWEFLSSIARVGRLARAEKTDVIYTLDRTIAPKIAAVVSRLTGCPLVLWSAYPGYPGEGRWNRVVLQQARHIHVHSRFLQDRLRPFVPDPDRLTMIPCALQLERYAPGRSGAPARAALGIAEDTPLILMPGRLSPFKGQEDLLEAAAAVLQKRPDVLFLIAGRDTVEAVHTHGPQATSFQAILERRIAELGLGESVRLIGYYPDLIELIAAADIVTMPSWEEPFGLVALEGMAMGKPVVATGAGGVPEFMRDGETGYLVPSRRPDALAEALLKLLDDPRRGREMGREGRRSVEQRHTAQVYAERVADVLRGAAHPRPFPQARPAAAPRVADECVRDITQ